MSSCLDAIINLFIFLIIIGLIPICLIEFQYRDPTIPFMPKVTITIIIMGFVLWYFSSNDNIDNTLYNDNNDYSYTLNDKNKLFKYKKNYNYKNKNKSCCYQTDVKTYEKITKINTLNNLKKLNKTQEFKKMFEKNGEDRENWNWQSRDRLMGKKQLDESDIGSEDIENMTLSDD